MSAEKHIFLKPNPRYAVELSPFGAGLVSFVLDGEEMLYAGPWDFDRPNRGYNGQFIAPVAGRILKGRLGDFTFPLNEDCKSLHSGSLGTAWKEFESEIVEKSMQIEVIFTRMDKGFGGKTRAIARYVFSKDEPKFLLDLSYESSVPTPANITNHLYFRLGESDMADVWLRIPASKVCAYDKILIPLGFGDVNEALDFRQGKTLAKPLDHAFLLDDGFVEAKGKRFGMEARTSASAVVAFRLKNGGFTLEFANHPLLGKESIQPPGKVDGTATEYRFFAL